jgi:hypothetical protein
MVSNDWSIDWRNLTNTKFLALPARGPAVPLVLNPHRHPALPLRPSRP